MKNEVRKIRLSTTSPLFIGSGEKFAEYEYFHDSDQQKVVIFSIEGLMSSLAPELQKAYLTLINQIAQDKSTNVARKYRARLYDFINNNNLNELIKNLKTSKVIDCFSESVSEIALFNNSPQGFYIPGSSIKGAIRSLVLKSLLRKDLQLMKRIEIEDDPKNAGIKDEKIALKIENYLFNIREKSMLEDFMRVLQVSDSEILPPENFEVMKICSVNLEKEKLEYMMIYQLVMKEYQTANFTLALDTQLLERFKQSAKTSGRGFIPFRDLDDLLSIIEKETQAEKDYFYNTVSPFEYSSAKSGTRLNSEYGKMKLTVGMTQKNEPSNFYMGGNNGFDRHTIWSLFDINQSPYLKRAKIKHLPRLPRNRETGEAVFRDNDNYLPRCLRVFENGYNQEGSLRYLYSFGWCRLSVVD
ncbi:MAG: type III-A CRISPR-associated RAMP protein Csm5 [Candidatus Caenarcaniphilales bacterium]|nr:type III-A CRISPR-associated RAMP protein Csm5 [Candidatus Caenarcaniphilales bacterium]